LTGREFIFALLIYSMESIIEKEFITCGSCNLKFEREKEYKHCSNCFACTGCEIYYCPRCENEITVRPVRSIRARSEEENNSTIRFTGPERC
jgi:hypothetical protein